MPLWVMVGMLAVLVALVMYSIGTWKAFRAKAVSRSSVTFLWVGFVFDSLATTAMAIQNGGIARDLHTLLAFLVMAGMLIATILATMALSPSRSALSATVAKWTVVPWALWVIMFVWAFIQRRG